jgi:hypothetical protein
MAALPRSGAGKVLKRELRATVDDGLTTMIEAARSDTG